MLDRIRAIILKDKTFLLVTDATGEFYWTPGGEQERGESHEQTLRRELLEEVNLELETMSFFASANSVDRKGTSYYYLCSVKGEVRPGKEIKGFSWFSFEDYKKRRILAQAKQGLDIVSEKLRAQGLI